MNMIKDNERIGVLILGYLGDVINTSGIFRHIKSVKPDVNLSIITLKSSIPAAKGIKEIDNIYPADESVRYSVANTIKFAFSLRNKFDTIIVLDNSLRTAYLAFFTGAKRRIGRGRELRELFLTDVIPYPKEERDCAVPVWEHYARCLIPLKLYKENIGTFFDFPPEDDNFVTNLLKKEGLYGEKLAGICPACLKKWKSMKFDDILNLIKHLNQKTNYKAVIIGGEDIVYLTEKLKQDKSAVFYDFAGRTSFAQTCALIDKCAKFISIDTSCLHLALARKVPTLAIFYSNLYKKWGPSDLSYNALYVNEFSKDTDINVLLEKFNALSDKK